MVLSCKCTRHCIQFFQLLLLHMYIIYTCIYVREHYTMTCTCTYIFLFLHACAAVACTTYVLYCEHVLLCRKCHRLMCSILASVIEERKSLRRKDARRECAGTTYSVLSLVVSLPRPSPSY